MSKPILLMTRPLAAAERFVAGLAARAVAQAQVIYAPLVEIKQTQPPPRMGRDEGAIFTSSNGVLFGPDGAGRTAYCVGKRTAEQATAKGWKVVLCALDADDLVTQMKMRDISSPLIHLAGAFRRGDIAERLTNGGFDVSVSELYTQTLLSFDGHVQSLLSGEATVIVPLFSPRTAAQFGTQARIAPNTEVLAMSGAVADVLAGARVKCVHIVEAPTGDEMRRGVEKLLCGDRLP